MGIVEGIVVLLKLIFAIFGWWKERDDATRKAKQEALNVVLTAIHAGDRTGITSAFDQLNQL